MSATIVSTSDAAVDGRRPLSAGQRRAWFLQTRDPEDATLNVCVGYRLSGALDPGRMRAAVDEVVARHEILRTAYGSGVDGEPYQIARDGLRPSWHELDLSELPAASRARRLEVLARRALGEPFDLAAAAPLRITLIRTGTAEFIFVLIVHTICWDDDSWHVFRDELNAAYNGAPPSSDRQAQFADVAALVAPEPDDATIGYWRRALCPLPESLELPGRADAAAIGSRPTGRCLLPVSPGLVERVNAFADAHESTLFAVLLAAYHAVIHRYTGATDFLIAIPVSTRPAAATSVIGYFGNTLLLRLALRPADSFANFVATVAETWARAFANRHVGIDRVVREVNPGRAAGKDGLAQLVRVGFGTREVAGGFDLDGVAATAVELGRPASPMPLRCTVVLDRGRVALEAEYWTGQPAPDLVERLCTHLLRLLDSGLVDPGCRVDELVVFSETERARILALSHGELVETPPTTVVDLFQGRVDATPGAVAIVAPGHDGVPDVELTYDGLNRRANRLARNLIEQGIGAEDIVAVPIATSVEFVVAVLGVLKAGAAYLPIDPANPEERIGLIDRDARPVSVLDLVALATAEQSAVAQSEQDPTDTDRVRPLRPGNLAYLIYTSGSTGKPKGVPVSHAAIAEHLEGFCAEWTMTSHDRLLQSAPVSFDASLLDIFVTLTVGACLVVPKPGAFRDIPYIAELIARCGVTVLHMVPSTLGTFLLLPEVSEWRALRHVPVGGEALRGEVADRFAGVFDAELRNHYGPTEAVVSATHLSVEGPQGIRTVPIGVPNRNVYVYVLDERLHPTPSGVVGEIYLGGAQLARGYLNQAGLTAERFVADPFLPGQRLYRTGDLARRKDDGEIEFVGRADSQVKVRGYRIELGEVEAALVGHSLVAECVVGAVSDRAIGTMLAAYVVPVDGFEIDFEDLRAHAAAVLPEYMVPVAFAVIDEIPLTPHGKLDQHALPEPVRNIAPLYREPSTATEIRLAEHYASIFALERVGVEDSFFDLGGHSLLAGRLMLWIGAEFGVGLDVRVLFDTPTVAGLAALIEATSPAAHCAMPATERAIKPGGTPNGG